MTSSSYQVLVLGCGDVGSAVGHALFRAGHRVLLCDLPRPAHARRGMAFTDALYDGEAVLDGVTARQVHSTDEVRACWQGGAVVPVTTLPERELLAEPGFEVLIDATLRRSRPPGDCGCTRSALSRDRTCRRRRSVPC